MKNIVFIIITVAILSSFIITSFADTPLSISELKDKAVEFGYISEFDNISMDSEGQVYIGVYTYDELLQLLNSPFETTTAVSSAASTSAETTKAETEPPKKVGFSIKKQESETTDKIETPKTYKTQTVKTDVGTDALTDERTAAENTLLFFNVIQIGLLIFLLIRSFRR